VTTARLTQTSVWLQSALVQRGASQHTNVSFHQTTV
jgi:hypothetical protein